MQSQEKIIQFFVYLHPQIYGYFRSKAKDNKYKKKNGAEIPKILGNVPENCKENCV
jgi:hypothetical protein